MDRTEVAQTLREIADDHRLISTVGILIKNELVLCRDQDMTSQSHNGMVIFNVDGTSSSVIRIRTTTAIKLVLIFLADEFDKSAVVSDTTD